jgi:hypothetical protein
MCGRRLALGLRCGHERWGSGFRGITRAGACGRPYSPRPNDRSGSRADYALEPSPDFERRPTQATISLKREYPVKYGKRSNKWCKRHRRRLVDLADLTHDLTPVIGRPTVRVDDRSRCYEARIGVVRTCPDSVSSLGVQGLLLRVRVWLVVVGPGASRRRRGGPGRWTGRIRQVRCGWSFRSRRDRLSGGRITPAEQLVSNVA